MLGYITVLPQQLTKNMHLYLPVHRNNHPHTGTGNSENVDKAGNEEMAEKERKGTKYPFYQGILLSLFFCLFSEEKFSALQQPQVLW